VALVVSLEEQQTSKTAIEQEETGQWVPTEQPAVLVIPELVVPELVVQH
jgi:hypothetical protein